MTEVDKIKVIADLIINSKYSQYGDLIISRKQTKKLLPESHGLYDYIVSYIKANSETFLLFGISITDRGNTYIKYRDKIVFTTK